MINLDEIELTPGFHEDHSGYCMMEAAAAYSNLEWTDEPSTVNPDIARLCRAINDWGTVMERDALKGFIPLVVLTGDTYSQYVHDQVETRFTYDEELAEYHFVAPLHPVECLGELVDRLTFELDMKELSLAAHV